MWTWIHAHTCEEESSYSLEVLPGGKEHVQCRYLEGFSLFWWATTSGAQEAV